MSFKIKKSLITFIAVISTAASGAALATFALAGSPAQSVSAEEVTAVADSCTHEIASINIVAQPTKKTGYKAFETLDTTGMVVKTHCGICYNDVEAIDGYTIKYKSGDCLHAGDTSVTVEYQGKRATLTGLSVNKIAVEVEWQYAEDVNATEWGEWKSEFIYDPATEGLKPNVRAHFFANGQEYTYRASNELVTAVKDGEPQSSIKDAGTYTLSLNADAAEFSDFEFSNNSAELTIAPAEIELNNEVNFYWQLLGYDSALRSGYIDSDYKYYSENGSGRTYVKRSIVRDRNEQVEIGLFGARSTENNPESGVYDIEYVEDSTGQGLGKYTAAATLTLNTANYKFKCTGTIDADRHMTVIINADGTVTITKEWYIAQIDNGLLSQHKDGVSYGKEWSIKNWTYGAYQTQYAPRLEHGDPGEYGSVKEFTADDDLVTFELFRIETAGVVSREKIGETFNRYEFANYINGSVPAGMYILTVHVDSYTSVQHVHWYDGTQHDTDSAGVFYDAFEREFVFTVEKADFTQTNIDELDGKTYNYTYDGKLHLFDDTFELSATVPTARKGIWANSEYSSFFGAAQLNFNLARWNTGAYLTETGIASYNNERQKPQGVDTYTVFYKLVAPNYNDLYTESGDTDKKYFTVVINKAVYDMSGVTFGNLEATYDGTVKTITVSGLPAGVTYRVDGVVNAGTHKLIVTFTGNTVNYEEIPSDSATLVIKKAHVAVPEDRTATLEGETYTYVAESGLYAPMGEAVYTEAGVYDISLKLKDVNNYAWRKSDGTVLDDATVEIKLTLNEKPATTDPVTPDKPENPDGGDNNGGNGLDVWAYLDIVAGVIIAAEIVFIVLKLVRRNKNTEGEE